MTSASHPYWFNFDSEDVSKADLSLLDDHLLQKTNVLFRIQAHLEFGFEHFDNPGLFNFSFYSY